MYNKNWLLLLAGEFHSFSFSLILSPPSTWVVMPEEFSKMPCSKEKKWAYRMWVAPFPLRYFEAKNEVIWWAFTLFVLSITTVVGYCSGVSHFLAITLIIWSVSHQSVMFRLVPWISWSQRTIRFHNEYVEQRETAVFRGMRSMQPIMGMPLTSMADDRTGYLIYAVYAIQ